MRVAPTALAQGYCGHCKIRQAAFHCVLASQWPARIRNLTRSLSSPFWHTKGFVMHIAFRHLQHLIQTALLAALPAVVGPGGARAEDPGWSMGVYGGPYYDTEPAGFVNGRAHFDTQYLLALTGSTTLWRSESLPLALELDAMLGQQFGQASLIEVAVAPVLRWSGFPWSNTVQTSLRAGPLGLSYTSEVSPLERGTEGRGAQWLNYFMLELALAPPEQKKWEVFVRLHHRCSVYDLINNYGANGEDFFALGYRRKF
jgi:hypothetical protein